MICRIVNLSIANLPFRESKIGLSGVFSDLASIINMVTVAGQPGIFTRFPELTLHVYNCRMAVFIQEKNLFKMIRQKIIYVK